MAATVTESYRHTQQGYLMMIALGAALALLLYLLVAIGSHPVIVVLAIVFAVLFVLFSSLTVQVNWTAVEVWFGPGLIRRRILLEKIESARVVRNPWYYGWGIRWIPRGWLFNVSGTAAVELRLKTGKRFRIGTNAPEALLRALELRGVEAGQ